VAADLVQIIRDGLAAWSRGDSEGVLIGLDPEIEFETSGVFPGLEPIYRGHDGFRRFFADFRTPWEDISIDVERLVAGEEPLIVMVGRFHATGRDRIPVERPVSIVFSGSQSLITEMRSYGTWEEGFEAAGVPAERRVGD
jgi:ketosteroid isomerase-like protein